MLQGLLALAAVLNVLALTSFAVLVVLRVKYDRVTARNLSVLATLKAAFLTHTFDATPLPASAVRLARAYPLVAGSLLVTMADQIRGEDLERLSRAMANLGIIGPLAREGRSPHARRRAAAAEALALLGDAGKAQLQTLYDEARDPEALMLAVAGAGVGPAAADIVDHYRRPDHRSPLLLASALTRLCQARGPYAALALLDDATIRDQNRAAVLFSLSEHLTAPMSMRLLHECQDESPSVRAAAMRGLAQLADERFLPAINLMLHDAWPEVRMAAAEACGAVGGARASAMLTPVLCDPLWSVRAAAAEALTGMGSVGRQVLEIAARDEGGSDAAAVYLAQETAA